MFDDQDEIDRKTSEPDLLRLFFYQDFYKYLLNKLDRIK